MSCWKLAGQPRSPIGEVIRIDLFLVLRSQMCLPTFNSRFSWVNSNDPQFLMKLTNHPGRYCKAKQNLPNDHGQNDQNHGKKPIKNTSPLHVQSANEKLDKSLIINILVKTLTTYMILYNINLQTRQNQL